jgi:myo-inositol 2-dehydrogenase / D-chiro-inositol 1-dehydrogenase
MKQKFYSQVKIERVFFFGADDRQQVGEETAMRFGIIGAGRIGKIHASNVAARKDCEVRFVADADRAAAKSLAEATGGAIAEIEAILASKDIDAIAICAPTDMHADLIEKAARAKKAIFCEKPVDLDANRIRACLDVVASTGALLMVGFNRRFDPNFAALQKRIRDGEIGNVEIVSITSRDPSPPPVSYIARSGGLFRDMMIHDFDMARFLLGEDPVAVSAMGSALVDKAIGEAGDVDTAVVIMETKSGKVAQISNSRRATYGYDQRIEAHGAKGMLRAENIRETTVEFAGAQGFAGDKVLNFFLERYAAAYRGELDAFIKAVSAGRAPAPSGEDGLRANLLADAANLSWRTKQRVMLG